MPSPAVVSYLDQTGQPRRLVVRLDTDGTVPVFEQLRAQLSVMVAVGHLPPGVRLPTVRHLADRLSLAPGTVARTYRELDQDGVVTGRGRLGTFVVDEPPESEPLHERRRRLDEAATRFAFAARQLGVDAVGAHTALDRAIESVAAGEADDTREI